MAYLEVDDNIKIKMNLTETESEGAKWINLAQDTEYGKETGFHKEQGIS